ncbi:MAG: hypothetical protein ACXACW_05185 [Candidatus Hodarchaeales archaeon]|jgi:hypothetical protein
MAINNTNTLSTKIGLDSNSTYIRLEIYLGTGQQSSVGYHVYANKADYLAGEKIINNVINFDFSNYNSGVLTSAEVTLDNLHDLAIAELGNRGLDVSKLSKVDL